MNTLLILGIIVMSALITLLGKRELERWQEEKRHQEYIKAQQDRIAFEQRIQDLVDKRLKEITGE